MLKIIPSNKTNYMIVCFSLFQICNIFGRTLFSSDTNSTYTLSARHFYWHIFVDDLRLCGKFAACNDHK